MTTSRYSHPKVLPFLCLTEMWERFGFYVAQGFLVLYMTQQFHLSDDATYTISGIFAALLYISPFIGGYLADRLLGFTTAILWGGTLLMLGYGTLAISHSPLVFFFGLAIIVVGNGLFKPNISSLLGTQYESDNPKRDSGFTIFYIGINLGVAFSGLSGYVQAKYGWGVTYALASIGMIIALITFLTGLRYLKIKNPIKPALNTKLIILFGCIIAIIGVNFLLRLHALTNILLPLTGVVLLFFLGLLISRHHNEERKNLILLNSLIFASVIFWMLFLQLFNSANLYVSRLVDQHLFSVPLTTTVFWASESVYILLLGPIFAWFWQSLGARNLNPNPLWKFFLGILFTGSCFIILAFSTYFPNSAGLVHALWIFSAYLVLTIGELLISPVGLSAVTTLSPQNRVGMMMGVWFVATGFGGYFAGLIAKLANVDPSITATADKLAIYRNAFFIYAAIAFVVAFILLVLQLLVRTQNKYHTR